MRRLRVPPRELAGLAGVLVAAVLVGILGYVVIDAAQARDQATRALEAQAEQAMDARAAQTRRIDDLSGQVGTLRDQVAAQQGTIAAQSQAIADLSEQLRRADVDPVATDPAPTASPGTAGVRRPGGRPPPPQSSSEPPSTSQPSPAPSPKPTPNPSTSPSPAPAPEPLCLPLDLLCIG